MLDEKTMNFCDSSRCFLTRSASMAKYGYSGRTIQTSLNRCKTYSNLRCEKSALSDISRPSTVRYFSIRFLIKPSQNQAMRDLIDSVSNARFTRRFGAPKRRKIARCAADCYTMGAWATSRPANSLAIRSEERRVGKEVGSL